MVRNKGTLLMFQILNIVYIICFIMTDSYALPNNQDVIVEFDVLDNTSMTFYDGVGNTTIQSLDKTAPTVVRSYKNGVNVMIEACDNEAGLWKVTEEAGGEAICELSGASDIEVGRLSSQSIGTIYVYDQAGNYASKILTTDTEAPSVAVTSASSEGFTLDLSDDTSGLCKVTDDNGRVLKDYGATNPKYPKNDTFSYVGELHSLVVYDCCGNSTTVTIIEKPAGDTTVKVYDMVENCNAYSVDGTAPTITMAYKNSTNVVVEASDAASGLWKVTEEVGGEAICELSGASDIGFGRLSSQLIGTIYVYDQAGNYASKVLTTDTEAPSVEVTSASSEGFTLNLSDDTSGLCKVTDDNGRVLKDYGATNPKYPKSDTFSYVGELHGLVVYDCCGNSTTVTIMEKPAGDTTVKVYDMVENCNAYSVDGEGPQVVGAYKKGTSSIVKASDAVSGLWKITDGVDGQTVESLSGASDIVIFTMDDEEIETLYVYDEAGNYTPLTLIPDDGGPEVISVVYDGKDYTVTMQDSESGISKVVKGSDKTQTLESYSDYPTTEQSYKGSLDDGETSLYLVDALGNETLVNLDLSGPELVKVYTNDENMEYMIALGDENGISRIVYGDYDSDDDGVDLSGAPANVILYIHIDTVSGLSVQDVGDYGALEDGPVVVNITSNEVVDTLTVYDGADNPSVVNLTALAEAQETEVDNQGPKYSIVYHDGKYLLTLEDEAGLGNVVAGNSPHGVVHEITGYPTSWTSSLSSNPAGETTLIAYDGLHNAREIPLTVDDEAGPVVEWAYKNSQDNCIYAKLSDSVGMEEIFGRDEEGQEGAQRAILEGLPRETVVRYELKEGDTGFIVKDLFDNATPVILNDVTLEVTKAYKNANGDVIAVMFEETDNDKGISKVTYMDGTPINATIVDDADTGHVYQVDAGTTEIRVYQSDEVHYVDIQLTLEGIGPVIKANVEGGQTYVNEEGSKVVIKAIDEQSGVKRVVAGDTSIEIEGLADEAMRQIITNGVSQVVVYDGVGNATTVNVGDIDVDATKPTGTIEYVRESNNYVIKLEDDAAGLWKLVWNEGELDEEELVNYSEDDTPYPQSTQKIETISSVIGLESLKVYDAVGNVASIDLSNVRCIVTYAYKNATGTKIALSLFDSRGIYKLGIVNANGEERIIEVFDEGVQGIYKCYNTTAGTTRVNIYYDDENGIEWELDLYEGAPTVIDKKAYSLVGIKKVAYDDGTRVNFKDYIPTRVELDLEGHGGVTVVDSLGNEVVVE